MTGELSRIAAALFERVVQKNLEDVRGEATRQLAELQHGEADEADVDRVVAAVVRAIRAYIDALNLTSAREARATYIDKLYELKEAAQAVLRHGGPPREGVERVHEVVSAELASLDAALAAVGGEDLVSMDGAVLEERMLPFGAHAKLETKEGQAELIAELVRRGHAEEVAGWAVGVLSGTERSTAAGLP